jgi:hypothetical protein
MRGAMNHGASREEVNAVRDVVVHICKLAGMCKLEQLESSNSWGWRNGVAKL